MTDDSIATSIKHKLEGLAARLKVSVQKIRTDFLLERLASRLSVDRELAEQLVFKGGIVSRRVYLTDRFTKDIDLATSLPKDSETYDKVSKAAQAILPDGCWYKLKEVAPLKLQAKDAGARISFHSGIGNAPANLSRTTVVNVDLGFSPTTYSHWETTQGILGDPPLNWKVCDIELTVAEKIHALLSRSDDNTRTKDVYDISRLITDCSPEKLNLALIDTFKEARSALPDNLSEALKAIDTARLSLGWKRISEDIGTDLTFEKAWEKVRIEVRRIEEHLTLRAKSNSPDVDASIRRSKEALVSKSLKKQKF